jgi:small-conductance mechanosensitive channel
MLAHPTRLGVRVAALLFALSSAVLAADNAKPAAASPGAAQQSATPGGAPTPASAPPAADPKPIPLANISASAEAADASLRAVEDALATPAAVDAIAADIVPFAREFDSVARASRAALAGREQRGRINDAEADLQGLQGRLAGWEKVLTRRSEELQGHLTRLADMRRTWQATDELAKASDLPKAVTERTATVLRSIDRVRKRVENSRDNLFTLQDRVSRFQARAGEQRESLKQAMALAVGGLLVRDSSPLWGQAGSRYDDKPAAPLSDAIAANLAGSYANAAEYVRANQARLALLPIIVLVFLIGLWAARRSLRLRIDDEPGLKAASWLFERPLAATLLATVLCSPWVLMYAPREINLLLLAVALPPTILILRRAIDPRLAPFLYALLVLYVLSRLLEVLDAVPAIERVLFQVQMLATIGVLAWLLRRHYLVRRESGAPVNRSVNWTIRGIRTATAGFAAALVADLSGYTQLGRFVADATLGAIYTAVILYAGVQVVYGLIRLTLNLWPLQTLAMVRNHTSAIERRARLATRWTAIAVWLLATLDLAALLEPVKDHLTAAATAQFQIGEIGISFGGVLFFIVTIWGAVLVSRLARFVLDEEVFSRLSLPRGIPYALTTILHYVLLVGGVLIAIVSTGINLDRFTIIAGAVGVGAGFGLQGIVNNFVSGLILLFERPVKVGDSVEMASRGGQIQHIGIRACVMRTGDGAEIIVPNSMLIAGEVTNWTLSDRQRRIEIPIGVGYGNDPEHVMTLLTQVAKEHDDILTYPAPETQFAGFGSHALEFKLGAWTARPERGGTIRSELCVRIYRVLTQEGIEIPYPQSSLHVRSIDQSVVDSFRERPQRRPRSDSARSADAIAHASRQDGDGR